MHHLKKLLPEIWAAPVLIAVFLFTRLVTIMSLPIFTDEAIYTRWAQIANFDSSWRFISLTDGKQPSFVWLDMVMMRLVEDPLLAGRLVSVIAGFIVAVGVYFLAYETFKGSKINSRIVALIASTLVVLYPFSIIYDRLALYESLLAAFFVWALYFQILLVRRLRLDIAMILGFILGGGVLTKSSMFLSIYISPFLLLLFNFKRPGLYQRALKFVIYSAVAIMIAYAMYSILRLSPHFHMINQKNEIFVYSIGSWLALANSQKIEFFLSNSRGLLDWFLTYFTVPYVLLAASAFLINRSFLREKIVLVLWFAFPLLSLCIFGKTLYPRYLLFMTMPLFPLVALGIYELFKRYKNGLVRLVFIITILFLPLRQMYYVLFDFKNAPIPRIDLEQLINGWPAGGGVMESIAFFEKEAKKGEIMVGTQGTFGLMPASYEIYLKDNRNVRINGFWPVESDKVPDLLLDYAKRIPTYFVFYQPCHGCDFPGDAPDGLDLVEVASYKKGLGTTALTIYQVKPQEDE